MRWTQVCDHNRYGLPSAPTVTLAGGSDVAQVSYFVTLSAPSTTIATGAAVSIEEVLRRGGGEETWAGRLLP